MHDQQYFERLDSLDRWQLEDERQDIRGRPLMTSSGERIGMIEHLLVDKHAEQVVAVRLDNGQCFRVEPLRIESDAVVLADGNGADRRGTEEHIPIVEEELVVGKRTVETGGIRVRSRIVEEDVQERIPLKEEHVTVTREPVRRPVEDNGRLFESREVEMHEMAEEAVVAKRAAVTDEIVVRKEAEERVENVSDTVRRTEVEVEDLGPESAAMTNRDRVTG